MSVSKEIVITQAKFWHMSKEDRCSTTEITKWFEKSNKNDKLGNIVGQKGYGYNASEVTMYVLKKIVLQQGWHECWGHDDYNINEVAS